MVKVLEPTRSDGSGSSGGGGSGGGREGGWGAHLDEGLLAVVTAREGANDDALRLEQLEEEARVVA